MSFSQEKSGNQEKLRVFHFFTYRSIGNGKIQFLNKVCSKILLYADLHGHRPGFLKGWSSFYQPSGIRLIRVGVV